MKKGFRAGNHAGWVWGFVTFTVSLTLTTSPGAVLGDNCDLFPIALPASQLSKAAPGTFIVDLSHGTSPGNFGWITWGGSPSDITLVDSLNTPGDSATYINPIDTADHQLSIGDWVRAKPGVSNSGQVRDALDALKAIDITVPVWDQARGVGERAMYRISAFARIRIVDYRLPGASRLTVNFLGWTKCIADDTPLKPTIPSQRHVHPDAGLERRPALFHTRRWLDSI